MKLAPKHVVTIVVAISAAVVLAPVGVMAATGSLTNIVDAYDSTRRARVSKANAVYVDTRPRTSTGTFNVQLETNSIIRYKVYEVAAPTRIAITDLSITVENNDTGTSLAGNVVELVQYVRKSGTAECGGAGWERKVLRKVTALRGHTSQLTFDGAPIVLPENTTRQCVVIFPTQLMTGTDTYVGVGGFVFT